MPAIDDASYDDALPKLEAEGVVPKGADAQTAADATRAALARLGAPAEHADVVAAGVRAAIIRRGINAKQYDPSLLEKQGLGDMAPQEAQRRYAGMLDPDTRDAMAEAQARAQGVAGTLGESFRRAYTTPVGGLAGFVGQVVGSDSLKNFATRQRMVEEAAAQGTDSPGAYHVGSMAGGIMPAINPVAMGVSMAGSTMSAMQAQDVGALGQAAAGVTVGYLGAKLPAYTQGLAVRALDSAATGIAAKLGVTAGVKTVAEVLGATPSVSQVAGRVMVDLGGGAAQYPGMVAANAAGAAVGHTFNGDPMIGLRQAWEQAKSMGDPIGWLEFAALHGAMKTGGSILGKGGTVGSRLLDPYRQPELAAKGALQSDIKDMVRQNDSNQERIQTSEQTAGYDEVLTQQHEAMQAQQRAAEIERENTAQTFKEDAQRGEMTVENRATQAEAVAQAEAADRLAAEREVFDAEQRQQALDTQAALAEQGRVVARKAKAQAEIDRLSAETEALSGIEPKVQDIQAELKQAQDDAVRAAARGSDADVREAQGRIVEARKRLSFWEADTQRLSTNRERIKALEPTLALPEPTMPKEAPERPVFEAPAEPAEETVRAKVRGEIEAMSPEQFDALLKRHLGEDDGVKIPGGGDEIRQGDIDELVRQLAEANGVKPAATGGFKRAVAPDAPVEEPKIQSTDTSLEGEAMGADRLNPTAPVDASHGDAPAAREVVKRTEKRALGRTLDAARRATAWVRRLPGSIYGGFQGNKEKATAPVAQVIMNSRSEADRGKVTKSTDVFGGSGSFGLAQSLSVHPNLKEHEVGDWNAARVEKIKIAQTEKPEAVMNELDDRGIWDRVLRVIEQEGSGGKATGRSENLVGDRIVPETGAFHPDLTPEQQRETALLQLLVDAMPRAGSQQGKIPHEEVYLKMRKAVRKYLEGANALHGEAVKRGVKVTYRQGDAYNRDYEAGNHHFIFLDPPYADTAGYNGTGIVPPEFHAKVAPLLERLRGQKNAGVYTDEAYWTRPRRYKGGGENTNDDTLQRVYNASDTFDTHRIGERIESLVTFDGSRPTPARIERPVSGRSGEESRPVGDGAGSGVGGGARAGTPEPARPGAAAPATSAKPVDRTVTDAHRNDAKSLAPLIGHDADIKVNENGSVTMTGERGKATVAYEDSYLPAEQVNRRAWFNSIVGEDRAAGLKKLSELLRRATLEQTVVRAATKETGGDDFAIKELGKLKPEEWKRLYDSSPVAGRTIRDDATGADLGALIAIHRSLSGTEGGANVLREEYGHHLWTTMTKHAPELADRILKTETSKEERDAIFNPDGTVRDANRALEVGTAKVNKALNRREAEAVKRGPPATGFLASVYRFLSKFLPKSLREDPALRPSEEAAKLWAEGKIRPEYAGKPGEAYAVRELKPDAPTVAGAGQSIRRSMAEEAREAKGGPVKVEDMVADGEAMLRDNWEAVSNAAAGEAPLTPEMIVPVKFEAQDRLAKAAERGGLAGMRDLEAAHTAIDKLQQTGTLAGEILRRLQFDVNRESDVARIIKDSVYGSRSEYWKRRIREAKNRTEQIKVGDDYARDLKTIIGTVRNKTGVDITRPDIGNLFKGDAYGVRALEREIRLATPKTRPDAALDWWNTRFSWGGALAETTRYSILNFSSGIPQAVGAAMFGVKSVGKRLTDSLITALNKDAQKIGGFEGSGQVLRETGNNLREAVGIATEMMLTGRSVARENLTGKRPSHSISDETASGENELPILHSERHRQLSAAARVAVGPGAAITGFVDEMVWATTFRQHQTFAAARKRALGDNRTLEEIKGDQDIKDNAEKEADFVTMRGGYTGPLAKMAEAGAALRQPTYRIKVGDKYHIHTAWAHLPGYALMPIYKSVVKALAEAAATANLPGNAFNLARGFQGKASAEKASIATGKTVETIMEERHRMAVEAGGRVMMAALAGTIGALWANAPQQGKDALLKEANHPQGTIGDVPASRFSPYYEITQLGAIGRQAAQEWGVKGGKQAINDSLLSSYDAFINRPLMTGVQAFSRKTTDPETGAPMTFLDKAGRTLQDETALGRPYIDLIRKATESEAKATGSYFDRNYSLSRENKVDQLSGEARGKGGFLRQMVFGGESLPSQTERDQIQRIVRVNDALFKQAGDNRVKQENAIWVPSYIDAVLHEDKALGHKWRMTPSELRVAQKVAGQHFTKMMESMPEDPNPAVMQLRMRAAWGQATALAKATGTRLAMPRIMAEREKLMAQR